MCRVFVALFRKKALAKAVCAWLDFGHHHQQRAMTFSVQDPLSSSFVSRVQYPVNDNVGENVRKATHYSKLFPLGIMPCHYARKMLN